MLVCHHCGKSVETGETVGRRDDCPHCGWDLHVCYNCRHYDRSVYNECRETQAERVLEKGKANFCDFFSPSADKKTGGVSKEDEAKSKLDSLFKKPK